MPHFYATIQHHSIASARVVSVGETLHAAKRAATREFGDGYQDHDIVIFDADLPEPHREVARRRISARRWSA